MLQKISKFKKNHVYVTEDGVILLCEYLWPDVTYFSRSGGPTPHCVVSTHASLMCIDLGPL